MSDVFSVYLSSKIYDEESEEGNNNLKDLFSSYKSKNIAPIKLKDELGKDGYSVKQFEKSWKAIDHVRPSIGGELSLNVNLEDQVVPNLVVVLLELSRFEKEGLRRFRGGRGRKVELLRRYKGENRIMPSKEARVLCKRLLSKNENIKLAVFSNTFDEGINKFCNKKGILYSGGSSMSTFLTTCRGAIGPNVKEKTVIERSIEFPPEMSQAGVSLLSYFGEIVNKRYPREPVKVGIEQDGHDVKMIVETPEGDVKDEVEKTLEDYGMVLSGSKEPKDIFDKRTDIIDMKNQLRMAETKLEQKSELLEMEKRRAEKNRERIETLEKRVSDLQSMVGESLRHTRSQVDSLQSIIGNISDRHGSQFNSALRVIEEYIEQDKDKVDKESVLQAVKTVNEEEPSILESIKKFIIDKSITTMSGRIVYETIVSVRESLPS